MKNEPKYRMPKVKESKASPAKLKRIKVFELLKEIRRKASGLQYGYTLNSKLDQLEKLL